MDQSNNIETQIQGLSKSLRFEDALNLIGTNNFRPNSCVPAFKVMNNLPKKSSSLFLVQTLIRLFFIPINRTYAKIIIELWKTEKGAENFNGSN